MALRCGADLTSGSSAIATATTKASTRRALPELAFKLLTHKHLRLFGRRRARRPQALAHSEFRSRARFSRASP